MHKAYMLLILFLLVVSIATAWPAFAADMLWRITHGDQDSLVFGKVEKTGKNTLEVSVAKVISGKPTKPLIEVEVKESDLAWLGQEINQGDKLVLSLVQNGERYAIKWGIYKVSSLDYKTLKIVAPDKWPGDMAALQWYINSNGKENEFYFKEVAVFVKDRSGASKQIYPLSETDSQCSTEFADPASSPPETGKSVSYGSIGRSAGIPAMGGAAALALAWLILKKRRNK